MGIVVKLDRTDVDVSLFLNHGNRSSGLSRRLNVFGSHRRRRRRRHFRFDFRRRPCFVCRGIRFDRFRRFGRRRRQFAQRHFFVFGQRVVRGGGLFRSGGRRRRAFFRLHLFPAAVNDRQRVFTARQNLRAQSGFRFRRFGGLPFLFQFFGTAVKNLRVGFGRHGRLQLVFFGQHLFFNAGRFLNVIFRRRSIGRIVGNHGVNVRSQKGAGNLDAQFLVVLTGGAHHQVPHIIVNQIVNDHVKIVFQHPGTHVRQIFHLTDGLVTGFVRHPHPDA